MISAASSFKRKAPELTDDEASQPTSNGGATEPTCSNPLGPLTWQGVRSHGASEPGSEPKTASTSKLEQLFQSAYAGSVGVERSLLKDIHAFGRWPRRITQPSTVPQQEENRLRKRFDKKKPNLNKASFDYCEALQSDEKRQLAESLIARVRALGHAPKESSKTGDPDAQDECKLARDIREARTAQIFTEEQQAELSSLLEADAAAGQEANLQMQRDLAENLLARVRVLGRLPKESNRSGDHGDPNAKDECKLAHDIRRACDARIFTKGEEAELTHFTESELTNLLWMAYEADGQVMVELFNQLGSLMRDGVELQSPYDQDLLEEVRWRVARVQEARLSEKYQQKWAKEEEERKSCLQDVKTTLQLLQSSKVRCTCYDFWHWRSVWRVDGTMASRLRETGHHQPHCALAMVSQSGLIRPTLDPDMQVQILFQSAGGPDRLMLVTSCAPAVVLEGSSDCDEGDSDSPTQGDVFVEMCLASGASVMDVACERITEHTDYFKGLGIFSQCGRCKSVIEAGVLFQGCFVDKRGTWTAAGKAFSFHHFSAACEATEVGSDSQCHSELELQSFPGFISSAWAGLMRHPLQTLPGADRGVTWKAYNQLLATCGICADLMVDAWKISPAGK